MSRKISDLQDRLLRYYSEQLQRYSLLETEVQRLQTSDDDSTEILINVRQSLQEISECENLNIALRNEWTSAQETASPELKETVQRVTKRIEQVIGLVSQSETQARDTQNQLRPLISGEAARRKVAEAYGAH